jgi:hypothetical protein
MLTRRRFYITNLNTNTIKYIATERIVPTTTTGWGATYNDSKSTWDSTTGVGKIVFDGVVTNIPNNGLENKTKLTAILEMPSTITEIGEYAFRYNVSYTGFKTINFNEGIQRIKQRAFLSNRGFTSIKLPDSLKYMDKYVFNTCGNLKSVTIGEGMRMFYHDGYTGENVAIGMFAATSLNTVIWNAIDCCDFVKSSYSPFTTESINGNTDHTKNPIKNVYFGNKVKHIPSCMFWKCPNISNTIVIPETCERIGDRAFQECTGIRTVIVKAKTPPLITPETYEQNPNATFGAGDGKNAVFRQYTTSWIVMPNLTIYVPYESLNAYKTDPNWSVYAGIIKPIDEAYGEGVDLGLRNSAGKKIIFADRNVGADNEYDIGYYFAWGDVIGYQPEEKSIDTTTSLFMGNASFYKSNYKYSNADYTVMTKYNATDGKTVLDASDDAAQSHMKGPWRMMTSEELNMLLDTTKFDIEIIGTDGEVETPLSMDNLRIGLKFTSKIAGFEGKYIIFPAGGAGVEDLAKDMHKTVSCLTSTRVSSNVKKCNMLYFYPYTDANTGEVKATIKNTTTDRFYGRQVRGVRIE